MSQKPTQPPPSPWSARWEKGAGWVLIIIGFVGIAIEIAGLFLDLEKILPLKEPSDILLLLVSFLAGALGIERVIAIGETRKPSAEQHSQVISKLGDVQAQADTTTVRLNDVLDLAEQAVERMSDMLCEKEEARKRFAAEKRIAECAHLFAMGYSLSEFISAFHHQIVERVRRGATVQILVIKPLSLARDLLQKNSKIRTYDLDIIIVLQHVRIINEALRDQTMTTNTRGRFEFRMMNWIPSCSIVTVDGEAGSQSGIMKVTVYPPHYKWPKAKGRLNMVINQRDQPYWFKHFIEQCKGLWTESHEWDGFIPEPPVDAKVKKANLYLRTGPGETFKELGRYIKGTRLTILQKDETETWINVCASDGSTGWMFAEGLELSIPLLDIPISETEPTSVSSNKIEQLNLPNS